MTLPSLFFALALAAPTASAGVPPTPQAGMATELSWRLLGPHRGGWSEMVEGVADRPDTFIMAAAGGGAWRTDDAGRTWRSLFDKGATAPVGAVAIAPSNPDIVYIGTGQPTPRYDVAGGAGVYRSSDGGKTWVATGLETTRHIGRIWVDPTNPDHVLVAALGHFFGPHPDRGVYESRDGGKSWTKTLFIDADTGVVDIVSSPSDPNTIWAASWQARQYPWQSYFTPIAGTGSTLWRSGDGGRTWAKAAGEGFPTGALGRISLAAASTPAGLRLYAMVSGGDKGGLYRSDDAGAHWRRVNEAGPMTGYYASHIAVAPNDPDVVYTVGQSIRRCDQGGARCEIIKGAPGGDDYHFVWINPKHPDHWATASDQGTAITIDGAKTFSSWYNQPTGQFYHVETDNQFPYHVYSGQQDSGTVSLASRSDYGAPNFRDWRPVGADERDFDIPDPEDPNIVYGTGLGGRLTRFDARTGATANIAPFLGPNYGLRQTSVDHHYVWVTPFAVSRTGPVTLYMGAEVVFKSTDRGQSWTVASPDLGGKTPGATHCDGDVKVEDARPCGYGGVWSITASSRHAGEVWVGTDSGLVQMTRDDGAHWTNVTPPGLPAWAKIASVEPSPTEDGGAYIAIDGQRIEDFAPHLMATHDYGKTWSDISKGLPTGQFASVVRADPVKPGLLFAGTETGVFYSIDDGAHWSALQTRLPTAWVRDLTLHGDDLIAATQGRAIWVLDNISPLRSLTAGGAGKTSALFPPAKAYRLRASNNKDTPLPADEPMAENPPIGAALDYWLAKPAMSAALEIRTKDGALVQRLSSEKRPEREGEIYFAKSWLSPQMPLPLTPGPHRVHWNLRWTQPNAIGYEYSIAATPGRDTPLKPTGPLAAPGDYTVALVVDGKTVSSQTLEVLADPRLSTRAETYDQTLQLARAACAKLEEARAAFGQRQALSDALKGMKPAGGELDHRIETAKGWIKSAEVLEDLSGRIAGLESDLEDSDLEPTQTQRAEFASLSSKVDQALTVWRDNLKAGLSDLNHALVAAGQKAITLPDGAHVKLDSDDPGEDLP